MLIVSNNLLFLNCKFYKISHFKSIDIKSLHYIIDKFLRCRIYIDLPVNTFYPIYFKPDISRNYKYNIFCILLGK